MISTLRPCVTSLTYSRLIQQQLLRPVYRLASSTYGPERACSRDENVYKAPAARVPSIKRLQEIATNNGLDINNEYLNHYRDFIENVICSAMDVVDSYPEPTLPVKYPRTPGYRPKQVENQLNGWYWRCDIKGADDGILHGKTVAIKDNIPVAGVPMMNGSYVLEGYVPEYDATVVTKILDAGGRITGKSTCEDMCFSGTSYITTKGAVRNPHNTNYAAGGSSSGCAALVAAGYVDMAVGADQAGSVRSPAAWCGIVGMKPTYGLIPYTGIVPIEFTIDCVGPMARNVYDCALLLEAIAGPDNGLDPRQPVNFTVPSYSKGFSTKTPGVKIGVLKEGFSHEQLQQDVADIVKTTAFQLTTLGAEVEEISIPIHLDAPDLFKGFNFQGAYDMILKGNGVGSQYNGFYPTSLADAIHKGLNTRINDMSHILKVVLLAGEYLNEEYGSRFYTKTQNIRRVLTKAYDNAFNDYDFIIMPTAPFKAYKLPPKDVSMKDYFAMSMTMMDNMMPFNMTGHPALTVNAGFSNGLPVGMMIVGRRFEDDQVLKLAYAYEKLRDKNAGV